MEVYSTSTTERTADAILYSTSTTDASVDAILNNNTQVAPTNEHEKLHARDSAFWFIVVPLLTIGVVVVLTIIVLLFLRKKRLDRLRHRLMPFYNFEPGEDETDWETELLEDAENYISNRKVYKSMENFSNPRRNRLVLD